MTTLQERLLKHCLKPEEVSGDTATKNARIEELVNWMDRYNEGDANPKWLARHASELAFHIAEIKGL